MLQPSKKTKTTRTLNNYQLLNLFNLNTRYKLSLSSKAFPKLSQKEILKRNKVLNIQKSILNFVRYYNSSNGEPMLELSQGYATGRTLKLYIKNKNILKIINNNNNKRVFLFGNYQKPHNLIKSIKNTKLYNKIKFETINLSKNPNSLANNIATLMIIPRYILTENFYTNFQKVSNSI